MGDNARAPYGSRSFEVILEYSLQAVKWFFDKGCHLVIFACNTASAKALRTIQQKHLPLLAPTRRVLGVVRPTVETVGMYTKTKKVGVLGTIGTVASESYPIEISKLFPDVITYQQACPMWVPIVEHDEINTLGAEFFVQRDLNLLLSQDKNIDTIILGCTHYPLLLPVINKFVPSNIKVVPQDAIVAHSLANYLLRHPEIEHRCLKQGDIQFYTTDNTDLFDKRSLIFYGEKVSSRKVSHLN